jgi:hypothetical protein
MDQHSNIRMVITYGQSPGPKKYYYVGSGDGCIHLLHPKFKNIKYSIMHDIII